MHGYLATAYGNVFMVVEALHSKDDSVSTVTESSRKLIVWRLNIALNLIALTDALLAEQPPQTEADVNAKKTVCLETHPPVACEEDWQSLLQTTSEENDVPREGTT